MKTEYQNLYYHPRILYKYYSLSKEYAIETKGDNISCYTFTPNIHKEDLQNSPSCNVVDKWRLIIFEGLLFYTSPAFFNDPFDSVLPTMPAMIPTLDERKEIIATLKRTHKIKRCDEERLLICDDFDTSFSLVLNKIGLPEMLQDEIWGKIKLELKRYREEIAITCFSEVNDSKLMWAHYADSYSGFCIEYDFTKMLNADFQKGIKKVIYSDKRPRENEFSNYREYVRAVLATKASCWQYEKEWRSTTIMPYTMCSNKMYPIINVKNCIKAIYLGYNMPSNYQNDVIKYYSGSKVKIYQMQLDGDEFKFSYNLC